MAAAEALRSRTTAAHAQGAHELLDGRREGDDHYAGDCVYAYTKLLYLIVGSQHPDMRCLSGMI